MQAQLYFDDQPGTIDVNLIMNSCNLFITQLDGRHVASVPFSDMQITQNIMLPAPACIQSNRRFTLLIFDEQVFASLHEKIKPFQKLSKKHWRPVIYSLLTVVVVVMLYFNLADLAVRYLPWSIENRIGNGVRTELVENHPVIRDKQAYDILGKMVTPLATAAHLDYPIRVEIIRNPQMNAVTLPGGNILIYSGLINKTRDQNVLAGVLAHEIGHAKYRHPMRGIINGLGMSTLFSLMSNSNISTQGQLFLELKYSRSLETQADMTGIQLLRANHLSTKPLATFLRNVSGASDSLAFLSTHPSGLQRENTLLANDVGGTRTLLTDAEWQKLKRSVQTKYPPSKDDDGY